MNLTEFIAGVKERLEIDNMDSAVAYYQREFLDTDPSAYDEGSFIMISRAFNAGAKNMRTEDFQTAVQIIEVMREALEFYHGALLLEDTSPLGEPNRDQNLMPVRLGTRAKEALAKADEIAGGKR